MGHEPLIPKGSQDFCKKKIIIFVFQILVESTGQDVWLATNSIKAVLHFERRNIKIWERCARWSERTVRRFRRKQ